MGRDSLLLLERQLNTAIIFTEAFMKRALSVLTTLALGITPVVFAAAPQLINYQGLLTDNGGVPVADGDYSVVFTIYDNPTAGAAVWTETQLVTTSDGVFAVLLGAINPVAHTVFSDSARYLGVAVSGDPELIPRVKLVSAPYALRSATVDGADGGQLSGSLSWTEELATLDDEPMMYVFDPAPAGSVSRKIFTRSPTDPNLGLFYNTNTESFEFKFGSTVMSVAMTSQRVGIGTDAPNSELDVAGTLRAQGVELGFQPTRSGNNSTVGGGSLNTASANWATAAGGFQNTASGQNSVVPGGELNLAGGNYSYAAGRRAKANHIGAFVWGDATNADVVSSADNQFVARAAGGFTLYTDAAMSTGVELAAGSGTWASLSDRNAKENVRPIDGAEILNKIARLDISRWNYKSQPRSIQHIGPMAQDFNALFTVGDKSTTISTIDPDGIALAAIKALYEKNNSLEQSAAELRDRLEKLEHALELLSQD